jgi:hypothetical protein
MNVTMTKKLLSDFQLEWKELDKKSNIILGYERHHKEVFNTSCPPICVSDCNRTNSTPLISQSKNGLASEDPLSQSTVCNGIHGDYNCCVTSDTVTDDNELSVILYYPLYSGWDFPQYPFLFKKWNEAACWAISRFKRDGLGNVWGQGKYPPFLSFDGQVMMMRSEVQVATESPMAKSMLENHFFSQVLFHLPKKEPILLSSDYVQLSKETFLMCTWGFCKNEPDYQQSANSIYRDEGKFSCQRMTINIIDKKFDVTLHQKLAKSSGFIQFEARFKYLKHTPPKNYGKIMGSVQHSLHSLFNYSHH